MNLYKIALISFALFDLGCASLSQNTNRSPATPMPRGDLIVQSLLVTPGSEAHQAFIDQINNPASQVIRLAMYHLTDLEVVNALVSAAKRPGTQVRVILDRQSLELSQSRRQIFNTLLSNGVQVKKSSPTFSITHEKAMIIDQSLAFITAINLTTEAAVTRDFGITTTDANIIQEMTSVFDSDFKNSDSLNAPTPSLMEPHLVWSPVNSQAKLSELILSAKPGSDLVATVENLNDPVIQKAFIFAASHGANVRLIIPECDKNKNPIYNYRYMEELSKKGVAVRVMPYPASPTDPYMHSKMISVGDQKAYIGSVNFSSHSTLQSRELGVIFTDSDPIRQIRDVFETDWSHSREPSNPPPSSCPKVMD